MTTCDRTGYEIGNLPSCVRGEFPFAVDTLPTCARRVYPWHVRTGRAFCAIPRNIDITTLYSVDEMLNAGRGLFDAI